MKRLSVVLIGIVAVVTLITGCGHQLETIQSYLPNWYPGMWWHYQVNAGDRLTIVPRAGEQTFQASHLEVGVLDEIQEGGFTAYVVIERYFTEGGVVVQTKFVDSATLSYYYMLDIPRAGITKKELDFPLWLGKEWRVFPGWEAQVVKQEVLDLPMGLMRTYRIDYRYDSDSWSIWYAPKAQNVVQIKKGSTNVSLLEYGWVTPDELREKIYADLEMMGKALPTSTLGELVMLLSVGEFAAQEQLERLMGKYYFTSD